MATASSLQITPPAAPGYTAATVTGGNLVVV